MNWEQILNEILADAPLALELIEAIIAAIKSTPGTPENDAALAVIAKFKKA
jgi:hypothetical protein